MLREVGLIFILILLISIVYGFNYSSESIEDNVNRKVKFDRRVKVRTFGKTTGKLSDTSQSL